MFLTRKMRRQRLRERFAFFIQAVALEAATMGFFILLYMAAK